MPCNNLAVLSANIDADVLAEVLALDDALETLREYVQEVTGEPTTLRRADAYFGHRPPAVPAAWITSASLTVCLVAGKLVVQSSASVALVQRVTPLVETFARDLGRALVTARSIATLSEQYTLISRTRTATGAQVARLRI